MREPHAVRAFDGLRLGILVARALSLYAAAVLGILGLVVLIVDAPSFSKYFGEMCSTFPWVVGGYLVSFSPAGLLCAALSPLPRRPITNALMGFGAGATIYGVCGIAVDLMDGKSPDWVFIIKLSTGIGGAWGLLAFLWSMWSHRRMSRIASL